MSNDILIAAYKKMRTLINTNPANKDFIIAEYSGLVEIINNFNGNKRNDYINNDPKTELQNMLKNPLEINIYNNFQKYNNNHPSPPMTDLSQQPNTYKQFITPEQYRQYIIDTTTRYDDRQKK